MYTKRGNEQEHDIGVKLFNNPCPCIIAYFLQEGLHDVKQVVLPHVLQPHLS